MAEYTPQDYVIYLGILLLVLWFFSRHVFRKIEFDKDFLTASIPYMVFGVVLRVLVDVGEYERNPLWNITPGVYITSIIILLVGLEAGLFLKDRFGVKYWTFPFFLGTLAAGYTSYKLFPYIENAERFFYPFAIALPLTGAIYVLSGFSARTELFRRTDNVAVIFAHLLDGSATFVGIDIYRFAEEHLLPDYLISLAGTAFVMIPLKIAVVLPALYFLKKWQEEEKAKGVAQAEQQYRMLKFVFFILGFGPGLRDALLPATVQ